MSHTWMGRVMTDSDDLVTSHTATHIATYTAAHTHLMSHTATHNIHCNIHSSDVSHCNTHCNIHCNTHCNTHCNIHCNTHCNIHCNTHNHLIPWLIHHANDSSESVQPVALTWCHTLQLTLPYTLRHTHWSDVRTDSGLGWSHLNSYKPLQKRWDSNSSTEMKSES